MTECMMTGPVHGAWHERIIKERNRAGMRDDLASAAVHLTWTGGSVSTAKDHKRAMASAGWTWFPSGMKLPLPAYRRSSRSASCPALKEAELPEKSAERCGSIPIPGMVAGELPKPPTAPAPSMRLPTMEGLETACEMRRSSWLTSGAGFCFQGQDTASRRRRPVTLGDLKGDLKAGGDFGSASTSASSGSLRNPGLFKESEFGMTLRWRPSSSLLRRKGSSSGRRGSPTPAKCGQDRGHTLGLEVRSFSPVEHGLLND